LSAAACKICDQPAAQSALGDVASAMREAINFCSTPDQLDETSRQLWQAWGVGRLSDDESTYLQALIERQRGARQTALAGGPAGKISERLSSRFTPRQRQRSPDRKASRDRRRTLGGSSALPNNLRHYYTEGQRAVLCIIAGEVKQTGVCDFPIDKIAALAGVCRTTVQTTLHEARRLGHLKITERPRPGRKHLSNLIEIISPEWRTWIKRGPSAASRIGSNSVKLVSTTKSRYLKKRVADERMRAEWWPSIEPRPPDFLYRSHGGAKQRAIRFERENRSR
jgi:hypothetical protein